MKKILYILIASTLFFCACQNKNKTQKTKNGEFVSLNNAQLFDIQKTKDYSFITTYEQNKTVFCTILIINNKNVKNLPKADFIIHKPIKSVAILSSTHIGYMESLGVEELITGSSNPYRFYNKKLLKKFEEGKIVNIGDDMKCNIESMIALKPDVVFTTGYEYNYNLKNILLKAGIPFIQCEY